MRLPATTLNAFALVPHVLARAHVFHVLALVQGEVSAENEFSARLAALA